MGNAVAAVYCCRLPDLTFKCQVTTSGQSGGFVVSAPFPELWRRRAVVSLRSWRDAILQSASLRSHSVHHAALRYWGTSAPCAAVWAATIWQVLRLVAPGHPPARPIFASSEPNPLLSQSTLSVAVSLSVLRVGPSLLFRRA